uniref:Uncharacterized protein n=1 Tax=Anguilla anguilla TaxID=7936 RepID=A0A0E9VT15_ANGAN
MTSSQSTVCATEKASSFYFTARLAMDAVVNSNV